MIKTVKAIIDENGNVQLLESIPLPVGHRALVTVLEDKPAMSVAGVTLLSEPALTEDWNRPEEDAAWSRLQPGQ